MKAISNMLLETTESMMVAIIRLSCADTSWARDIVIMGITVIMHMEIMSFVFHQMRDNSKITSHTGLKDTYKTNTQCTLNNPLTLTHFKSSNRCRWWISLNLLFNSSPFTCRNSNPLNLVILAWCIKCSSSSQLISPNTPWPNPVLLGSMYLLKQPTAGTLLSKLSKSLISTSAILLHQIFNRS